MPPVDFNGGQLKVAIVYSTARMHCRHLECALSACTPANIEKAL